MIACLLAGAHVGVACAAAFPEPADQSTFASAGLSGPARGGYVWSPELAPRGPIEIVISLSAQRAYVYRGGVRIGVSRVSTGKEGDETPTGVFTILQKERIHRSSLYDAPMPYMQRLTWSGVALHGALCLATPPPTGAYAGRGPLRARYTPSPRSARRW